MLFESMYIMYFKDILVRFDVLCIVYVFILYDFVMNLKCLDFFFINVLIFFCEYFFIVLYIFFELIVSIRRICKEKKYCLYKC